MPKLLLLLVFSVLFYSCKDQKEEKEYINHEKWKIADAYSNAPLKGNPKEIQQVFYIDLSDTSFSTALSGKANGNSFSRFDPEGNLVFQKKNLDTIMTDDAYYKYDENGVHYDFITYSRNGDTSRIKTISHKTGPGQYEIAYMAGSEQKFTFKISVSNNGEKVHTERHVIDIPQLTNMPRIAETSVYKNGRLIKKEENNIAFLMKTETIYRYSDKGFLESVVTTTYGESPTKEIFINNEHGDPVYYEKTVGVNRFERRWMKYEYDQKGNWIRRIAKEESMGKAYGGPAGPQYKVNPSTNEFEYPDYSMIVREIRY